MRVYRAWPGITERMASELHAHVWYIRVVALREGG